MKLGRYIVLDVIRSRGLFRDYEPSDRASFQALPRTPRRGAGGHRAEASAAGLSAEAGGVARCVWPGVGVAAPPPQQLLGCAALPPPVVAEVSKNIIDR